MSKPSDPSRNLLFGLLALQNGLIDQGALFAAFTAWTRDKARPLADHLAGRGGLDVDDRFVVEALVARHLKKHGDDVEKSLAAIPAARSTRVGLASIGEPAIEASLAGVGSAATRDDDEADLTASYAVGTATSDGQRFRILRPHAKGGLGAVFVAVDSELHREVALKQILEKHADDPASRQRFVAEAEITGGLEHPGVVPVYGLGTDAGGRPYYAMRFIRGESLKEAIARFHQDEALQKDPSLRSLELRRMLRRFTDVCNAIDYAHSRGVIHRDLKPANIIVGKHGETLVVDWGLAKAVGRADPSVGEQTLSPSSGGSSETLPGSALGTPAYMSPEQARGELTRIGPRSDVYSLGATLYCLLTGKPPFLGDDVGLILRQVQHGVASPRMLDPAIDQALEAVCLKAMATKPEDRYASPKALAEDVERWMADEPVAAWQEPFSRRARRWARRNRIAVMTAAVAALAALAGTASVLAVQTRANRDLRQANDQTRRERDLARQNFELARRAVDDYLTRVGQNPLLKEQGLHELRQDLLEAALRYYREFLRQRNDDPSLTTGAAAAHERVGDILIELGRPGDALAEYDDALTLIEALVRDRPDDHKVATAQVRLEAGRLQALRDDGRVPAAIAASERAIQIGEAMLVARLGTDDLPEILARTYNSVGAVLRAMNGRTDEALRASLRAHQLAEQAARDRAGDPSKTRTLLWVSRQTANLLQLRGRPDEARRVCEQGIALGNARIGLHPRDIEMRTHLANLVFALSFIEKAGGRPLEALRLSRSAVDTLAALARENPLLIRVRSSWADALNNLSQLQTDLGRSAEAEQSARATIELFEALAREVPSTPYFRIHSGYGYASLGKACLRAGSHGKALAMLKKAIAIIETSIDPEDLYNLSCNLALASTIADPAEGPAATNRQRRDADRGVATIRRAIELGFANSAVLKNDPDFDAFQSRPDFQALLLDLAFPADPFSKSTDADR